MATRINIFTPLAQRVLIAVFIVGLCAPGMGLALNLDRGASMGENRPPAPPPALREIARSPGTFLFQLKSFVQDNFGFRARLVRWHSRLCIGVLRSSPSAKVILGKDGWLFQADERVIEDYRCERPFTPGELAAWADALIQRKNWLNERGIRYVVLLAPNSHTMYAEHLPDSITLLGGRSRWVQLSEAIRTAGVIVADPRGSLNAAKENERLYHKTDTHWNDRGAFVAYAELVGLLKDFAGIRGPATREEFTAVEQDAPGGDLAGLLGLADTRREQWLRLIPKSPRRAVFTPPIDGQSRHFRVVSDLHHVSEIHRGAATDAGSAPDQLPRAVMFRDSFGTALMPFIAEHFSRVRFEWVDEGFVPEVVVEERPDVVIQEITERFLMREAPGTMGR